MSRFVVPTAEVGPKLEWGPRGIPLDQPRWNAPDGGALPRWATGHCHPALACRGPQHEVLRGAGATSETVLLKEAA
jgi:hypothetical protein